MKRIILSMLILSAMTASAMAGEWTGSLKIGFFQEETSMLDDVQITLVKAIQIAESQTEGTVTKAELDKEDGYVVYSIEFYNSDGKEREVIVDPVTGDILEKNKID